MSSPCFKCGSAGSCKHREIEPAPEVVERTPAPRGRASQIRRTER